MASPSTRPRPRVLFLTCHLPYPPISGGRRREHELLARLVRDFDVEVCAVTKTLDDDRLALAEVPWRHSGIQLFEAKAGGHPAPQIARHGSPDASAWIARNAVRFDVLHVEGFYLWQHVPDRRPPTLLGEQNVEYQLWEQRALFEPSRATRTAERAAWDAADLLAAVTYEDSAVIAAATGRAVRVVPDGCDHDTQIAHEVHVAGPSSVPAVTFVGNFAYEPNVDAGRWLADEIFPRVRARIAARLVLVGNAPPPELTALACEDITVTGRVPAVEPWLDASAVVACPLRVGGGVKVKALEALNRGCPIVATPNCTPGIPGAEHAMRVAGTTEDFAQALIDVLTDAAERRRLAAAARACALALPTWKDAAAALADCWHTLALPMERAA
jgi:glycosyltransferase involved in cell wall biosynthesis